MVNTKTAKHLLQIKVLRLPATTIFCWIRQYRELTAAYTFLFHRGLDEEDLKKWCIGFNGERITFPLINSFDQVLGFSNRIVACPDDNKAAKYINSKTDEFFEKRKFLYGINRLDKSLGYAYITEGQLDVILASKYGLTKNMVRYRLRLAKEKLKEYIILHENE